MKNNWQKDIHDRLGNYEKDAPDGLWEDICREMSDENGGYRRNGNLLCCIGYDARQVLWQLQV